RGRRHRILWDRPRAQRAPAKLTAPIARASAMTGNPLEQRLTELEVRIAFLDQTVQSLDATVATQGRMLDDLRREFAGLRDELGHVQVSLREAGRQEPPPPHY